MCQITNLDIPRANDLPAELAVYLLKQRLLGNNTPLPLESEWLTLFKFRVWHDPETPRHEECRCPDRLPPCRCARCNNRFRPNCRGELFCCLDCFLKADFDRIAVLILRFKGNIKKLRAYIRKLRYRATEKGINSREREYDKRNAKRDSNNEVEIFKPPVDLSLGDSIAAFLFENDRTHRQCQRIGCSNLLSEDKINGIQQRYCSSECREREKSQRRNSRSTKTESPCPIAEYIEAILKAFRS